MSRRAYELVLDECERLRFMNDKLIDDIVRIQRVRSGMREVPRGTKAPPKPEAIPAEIRDLYQGYSSRAVKSVVEQQVRQMRANGTPWSEIGRVLEAEINNEEHA